MTFREPYITPSQGPPKGSPRNSDATRSTNPNLFTNPIPFAQFDWPLAKRTPSLPPRLFHVNPGMFTNPIPFSQTDWSKTGIVPDWPVPAGIYNLVLLSSAAIAAAPFYQNDWSASRRVPDFLPDHPVRNVPILSALSTPFYQTDWSKTAMVPDWAPPQSIPLNLNLFTNPIPFAQFDWSKPFRAKPSVPDQQFYNSAQINFVAGTPFYQTEWPRTRTTPVAPPVLVLPLNLNLFKNTIPFAQLDWRPLSRAPRWLVEPKLPNITLSLAPPSITATLAATESPDIAAFLLAFSRWTPNVIQSETWTDNTKQDETWTPATIQSETWTDE